MADLEEFTKFFKCCGVPFKELLQASSISDISNETDQYTKKRFKDHLGGPSTPGERNIDKQCQTKVKQTVIFIHHELVQKLGKRVFYLLYLHTMDSFCKVLLLSFMVCNLIDIANYGL